MKTNRTIKKGDDKMAGPYPILKVYKRACLVDLPPHMKIFPVFHTSLLKPKSDSGFPGQALINQAESRHLRGHVLEHEDGSDELTERWEFDALLDSHNENGLHYLIKWKHHAPS